LREECQLGVRPFISLICLDATKFVSLGVSALKETICPKFRGKQLPKNAKSPIAVVVFAKKVFLKLLIKLAGKQRENLPLRIGPITPEMSFPA